MLHNYVLPYKISQKLKNTLYTASFKLEWRDQKHEHM